MTYYIISFGRVHIVVTSYMMTRNKGVAISERIIWCIWWHQQSLFGLYVRPKFFNDSSFDVLCFVWWCIFFPSVLMFLALLAFDVSLVLLQRNMALFFIIFLDYSMTNKQDSFTRAFSCSIIFMSDIMFDVMNVTTIVVFC